MPVGSLHIAVRSFAVAMVLLVLAGYVQPARAQSARAHTVLLSPVWTQGAVRLTWPAEPRPTVYVISTRTSPNDRFVAVDTVGDTSPTNIYEPPALPWIEVEVRKVTTMANGQPLVAAGYWLGRGGLDIAAWRTPGRVMLVVDSETAAALATELQVWKSDMQLEGWIVETTVLHDAARSDVKGLKRGLLDAYLQVGRPPLTHVFMVGDVPYAYTGGFSTRGGNFPPDGHENHCGAWSSDAYYADVVKSGSLPAEEDWTDATVNIVDPVLTLRAANRNVPGDGKFDQSVIPSDLDLNVGRLDMSDLPEFGTSETDRTREFELMRAYFIRNHAYRTGAMNLRRVAAIDDNLGEASDTQGDTVRVDEAYAASAWRGFSTIVPRDSIFEADFHYDQNTKRISLKDLPALLAYGCGYGGFDHCDFVANIHELATEPMYAAFTWMFGSYFGDVDSPDNMLRGMLANGGNALTAAWSGRPHWHMHLLGARMTTGEMARAAANNDGTYMGASVTRLATGETFALPFAMRTIPIGLVGDPTLRLPSPVMATAIQSELRGDSVHLAWASTPGVLLYTVEAGISLDDELALVTAVANTQSGTVEADIPAYRAAYVRVRPLGTDSLQVFTPLLGRGAIVATGVSGIGDAGEEPADDTVLGAYDLLGRPVDVRSISSTAGVYFVRTRSGIAKRVVTP